MKTISRTELERNLNGYSAHVELWSPDEGDSFLMLNCRELLGEHIDELTADQKKRLASVDKQVLTLANAKYEDETPDVGFLKLTADVIGGRVHRQAA